MRRNALGVLTTSLLAVACARAPVVPAQPRQANQLCEAKLQLGSLTEALADCDRALQAWPPYPEAWFNKGLIQMYLGQYADARKSFQEVVKRQPDNARAHNDLGVLAYQDGAFREAESSLRRALGIKPDWWKLEPQADAAAWRETAAVIRQNDPYCRGIVLLGLEARRIENECGRWQCTVVRGSGGLVWRQAVRSRLRGLRLDQPARFAAFERFSLRSCRSIALPRPRGRQPWNTRCPTGGVSGQIHRPNRACL